MHIGGVYAALVPERAAHQTGGVFFLRIEDTDKAREVPGATKLIVSSLTRYGIRIDEGETPDGTEKGDYGPYRQSNRAHIYQVFVRKLLEEGCAYPCFATEEKLAEMRRIQEDCKIPTGYYGKWAVWRDRPMAEIKKALEEKIPFVLRLRATGDINKEVLVEDLFKGTVRQPENNQDIVILKQNGLPTYHFAHVVDDHLMRTTHVFRGDEWLSSTALHLQMFGILGWTAPRYGHLSTISKKEGSSVRKLSKRKDPEASVEFYDRQGYPAPIVLEYLLNLANSSFEPWRVKNPTAPVSEYPFRLEELQDRSRSLFDIVKLESMSKEAVARMTAPEVYEGFRGWLKERLAETPGDENMSAWLARVEAQKDYTIAILNIERGVEPSRKDIAKWSDVPNMISFFYDDLFAAISHESKTALVADLKPEDIRQVAEAVIALYDPGLNKDDWLAAMKGRAQQIGFALDNKAYKANKEAFKGMFADFARVVRVALTGRTQAPDLYQMMKTMGKERVSRRLREL
jgi:glutamyl-tRNA synthetase